MKLKSARKFDAHLNVTRIGRNICFCGGGGTPDNSGQNAAAVMNAGIASDMWNQYKTTYLPKEQQFADSAFNYDTPANEEQKAGLANADVQQAITSNKAASDRNLQGMGIDPNSGIYADANAKQGIMDTAMQAGAQNSARTQTENLGYARKQDAISIGKGMPGTASAAVQASGNQYGQIANQQAQQNQTNSNNTSNAVAGGMALYKMLKDGGPVEKPGLSLVKKYAMGGPIMGNPRMQELMNNQNSMPIAQTGAPATSGVGIGDISQAAQFAKSVNDGNSVLEPLINNSITTGAVTPGLTAGSEQAGMLAAQNSGLGSSALESTVGAAGTGTAGTTAAGTTAAGTTAADAAAGAAAADTAATAAGTAGAAEATGAAAAGTETAAATAAAGASATGAAATGLASIGPVGWIAGAAMLLASQLKKDGGPITSAGEMPGLQDVKGSGKVTDIRKGGKIKGPGTETSDSVPLMGSHGEYMVNAEAVKMPGVKKQLVKINKAGLQKRYGLANVGRD
jgi:hypothetical protein